MMSIVRQTADQRVSDQLQQVEGRMQRPQAVAASLAGHQQQIFTTLFCTVTNKQRAYTVKKFDSLLLQLKQVGLPRETPAVSTAAVNAPAEAP